MTLLNATLIAMGNGVYAGSVISHPCPDTTVRVTSLSHDARKVQLFHHSIQVGDGILRRAGGHWMGRCTEFAGEWWLEAREGGSTLTFHESAPADAGAA